MSDLDHDTGPVDRVNTAQIVLPGERHISKTLLDGKVKVV